MTEDEMVGWHLKGVCSSCLISAIIIQCNMKLPVYRGRESWIQMSLIYLFNVVWLSNLPLT